MIRHATHADLPALLLLIRDCVAAMRAVGIEQWDEVYPNAETIERDMASGTLDVWIEDETVVACIVVDSHLDPLWQGLDWGPNSEPAAAVHRLMVHPSQQGRGLAKRLMLHAEHVARERSCVSIRLDTFQDNPVAMALYPRLGYRPTGTAMMRKGAFVGFEKILTLA